MDIVKENKAEKNLKKTSDSINGGAKLLTYLNYVLFYLRFILIYVLSALLELIGVGYVASLIVTAFAVGVTILVVFYIVGDDNYDKSEQLLQKLPQDISAPEKLNKGLANSKLPVLFYLFTEYLFDISCFYGLSRQFIITFYSQSHAIALLSMYQPVIFISVAWFTMWIAYVKYNDIFKKIQRQNLILGTLNYDVIKSHLAEKDNSKNKNYLLSSIYALFLSFLVFVGIQYYLSGSMSISHPYGISSFVFMLLLVSLLSYVFWGHKNSYWNILWTGFLSISGTLGMIFFAKIVLVALFGHLVSDFYYCSGVSVFIGISVGIGVLYSQILQAFSVKEQQVSAIFRFLDSGDIEKKLDKIALELDKSELRIGDHELTSSIDSATVSP